MNISNFTADFLVVGMDETTEKMSDQNSNETQAVKFEEDILQMSEQLKPIIDILLLAMLIVIMLSMGCEITIQQLWAHMRRPIGLSIGIVSQFIIKPLAAYAVVLASGVEGLRATGVLIISCCPGGVLSNTFTYFSDGDLPLSVAMTTASTIMAMGMLPANIWLYGRSFESVSLVIPYEKMALSLLIVTSPICVGMLIRWKLPKVAKWTTKIGTSTGLLIMLASLVIEIVAFPSMFTTASLKLYLIIVMLPLLGLGLGYFISAIFRQNVPIRKTVAIECGVQNFPIALTIISLSFPEEMQKDIVLLPWLYGFAMISCCSLLCVLYQVWKKIMERRNRILKVQPQIEAGPIDMMKKEINPKEAQVQLKSYNNNGNGNTADNTLQSTKEISNISGRI